VKLQVLGCHGGELPSCRTTCFLVDDVLSLDAGALTSSLSLEQLCKVDDILVGHSHFDHVKDLPLMADLIIGRRDKPVTIHASRECARALREYMFNNALWPDFTRIPTRKEPVLRIKAFRAGSTFQVGPYTVQSIPVHHPVESCGFVITRGRTSLAMSGDTGPTDKLWKVLNQTPTLKALLVETSFPNALQQLADVSGHLTPQTLRSELDKFERNGSSVLVYHLKPAFIQPLKRELAELPVEVLELGDTFEF
jgi:cAMP phosphodiesterase